MKISKVVLGVSLCSGFCVATALAQPNDTPTTVVNPPVPPLPVPRPGEPKAQIELDLKTLFAVLNVLSGEKPQYVFAASDFISGARIGFFGLNEWIDDFSRQRGARQYRLDQIEIEKLDEDAARVKVSYSLLSPYGEPEIATVEETETLDLKREIVPWKRSERWRIVAPNFEKLQPYRRLRLENIAYFASQRAGTLPQLRAEISVSQLKQCALGVMQFVQDYDEQFRFENEFWRDAIRPYVKNDALFLIPGTRDFYTFNDHLSDKSLAQINEPAQTVLFYEGRDEKPIFRYDGKAAIGFADGSVKLIAPDEAAKLIWKP